MRELRSRVEAFPADDVLGPEVLKLGRIGTGFRREMNQLYRAIEAPVVVGGDVSDEVGRVVLADFSAGNVNRWQVLDRYGNGNLAAFSQAQTKSTNWSAD